MDSFQSTLDQLEMETMARAAGHLTTFMFTMQYLPQFVQNARRKSVKGFSTLGIVIKLLGACFLAVNAYLTNEESSVVLYGAFNVIQHSMFMIQFSIYPSTDGRVGNFWGWLLLPLLPYLMGTMAPSTITWTNSIKPACQLLSHWPQLALCYRLKTTSGVSLTTQHLNMTGGMLGLWMCYIIPPKSLFTYTLYLNSMFQALSIYFLYFMYDHNKRRDGTPLKSVGTRA